MVLAALLATPGYTQDTLFSWDADNADSVIVEGEAARCLSIKGGSVLDTTEKHSGAASIRHSLSGAQRALGCEAFPKAFGGDVLDGGDAYFRWWMKIDPAMDWGPFQRKAKFARLTRTNQRVPSYTTIYLHDSSVSWAGAFNETGSDEYYYMDVDFDPSDGECRWSDWVPDLGADCTEWREYVLHYKRNSCIGCDDSLLELYVDGQLADRETGISFADFVPDDGVTTFDYAWAGMGGEIFPQLCPNDNPDCGAGGLIWIDEISIETDWTPDSGLTLPAGSRAYYPQVSTGRLNLVAQGTTTRSVECDESVSVSDSNGLTAHMLPAPYDYVDSFDGEPIEVIAAMGVECR